MPTRAAALLSTALLTGCAGGSAPPRVEPGDGTIDVGYGTVEERTATTSTSTLRPSEKKELSRYSSLAEMIEGRMAGVQVVNTPRGTEVLIRGRHTTSGGNAALVIIDGVPAGPTGIDRVSPYDVAQITILKDAGSTAIYGSRGANGVVIIRTRRATDR